MLNVASEPEGANVLSVSVSCPSCQYPLALGPAPQCPECGCTPDLMVRPRSDPVLPLVVGLASFTLACGHGLFHTMGWLLGGTSTLLFRPYAIVTVTSLLGAALWAIVWSMSRRRSSRVLWLLAVCCWFFPAALLVLTIVWHLAQGG